MQVSLLEQDSLYQNGVDVPCSSITLNSLLKSYESIRKRSLDICEPLQTEDYVLQTMPDVSPPKWHLAHTTWFFETFVLIPYLQAYRPFRPSYAYLFNSYYESVGERHPRTQRGHLSRPTIDEVFQYRAYVDKYIAELVSTNTKVLEDEIYQRLVLGIHHEQQHQELMLTDIKHSFAANPLRPVYKPLKRALSGSLTKLEWQEYQAGLFEMGHIGEGFAYDNEMPRHRVYRQAFKSASRLISNGEYQEFIDAGGYQLPELWLSDGWKIVNEDLWLAPLYWEKIDGCWWTMTLSGMQPVDDNAPVCHVSYYEADAFARWSGKRLLTEAEWETIATPKTIKGNFYENGYLQPQNTGADLSASQIYGDVWEWTQSPYVSYPGFRTSAGAIGEYNGKFMCNQIVLRGGSCVTASSHMRASYRNFFYPADRWQFSGIRLGDDL